MKLCNSRYYKNYKSWLKQETILLVVSCLHKCINSLTLSVPVTHLPVTRKCVNFSTVYNETLVAKGLNKLLSHAWVDEISNK